LVTPITANAVGSVTVFDTGSAHTSVTAVAQSHNEVTNLAGHQRKVSEIAERCSNSEARTF
jgi:hypothetical protein